MYTKFRPWKQRSSQSAGSPSSEPFASSCDQIIINKEAAAPTTLQFVNTAHPSDATSLKTIGAIRSHVAKEVHATRRQILKHQKRNGYRRNAESSSAAKADAQHGATQRSSPRMIDPRTPGPTIWLVPDRRDPFNRLANPLNDAECFLIEYYKLVIIPQTFGHINNEASKMLCFWIPFVLSDGGLLSAVLLVTCQCLLLHETKSNDGSIYARMAAEYKGACIRSIMSALSAEGTLFSDFTVAKVMVMCSYELKFGDDKNARCHAMAIGKMIELKGGSYNVFTHEYFNQIFARFWNLLAITTDCSGSPIIDSSTSSSN